LATLPRETLYQLQDGATTELRAREACALQILMEHKTNLDKVSLQLDDLVACGKELEQVMAKVCSMVPEFPVLAKLPVVDEIDHMVVIFRTTQEEAAKAQWELNL